MHVALLSCCSHSVPQRLYSTVLCLRQIQAGSDLLVNSWLKSSGVDQLYNCHMC
jgi:hypothetical protein